jgi:metallo-beta-lactamase class B
MLGTVLLLLAALAPDGGPAAPAAALPADLKPLRCMACEKWNRPHAPFRVFGNTYYVGVEGLSVVLVESSKGLVLMDGALPESVPLVLENLKALGKRIQDVKWIVMSHAHYDHVGGLAALARLSGARVAASPHAAGVLRAGIVGADDPQVGYGEVMRFPPVKKVTPMRDGETIRLGDLTLTMHHTPGHTPGGSSWTWRSCEGERCARMVYADSLNAVSAEGFRFTDHPQVVQQLRRSMDVMRTIPCDILISAHPDHSRLFQRVATRGSGPADRLFEPEACARYADVASARLERTLSAEASATSATSATGATKKTN